VIDDPQAFWKANQLYWHLRRDDRVSRPFNGNIEGLNACVLDLLFRDRERRDVEVIVQIDDRMQKVKGHQL